MKRKLTQILMLLTAVVSMGTFVSCKDTNEDLYNELRMKTLDENASLQAALQNAVQNLQGQIDVMKGQITVLENKHTCGPDGCTCYTSQIATLTTQVNGLTDKMNNMGMGGSGTKEEFQKNIEDIINGMGSIGGSGSGNIISQIIEGQKGSNDNIDALKKKVEELEALIAGIGSCKDCAAAIAKLEQGLIDANNVIKANTDKIAEIDGKLVTMSTDIQNAYDKASAAAAQADANKTLIDNVTTQVTTLTEAVEALKETAEKNGLDIAALTTRVETLEQTKADITKLQEEVEAAKAYADTKLVEAKTYVDTQVAAAVAGLATQADVNAKYEELKALIKDCPCDPEAIKAEIQKLSDKIDDIDGLTTEDVQKMIDAVNYLDRIEALEEADKTIAQDIASNLTKIIENAQLIEGLEARVSANETSIKDLQTSMETVKETIKDLTDRVDAAEAIVAETAAKVEALKGDVEKIQELLAKKVDNIIIQNTSNPLFGSISAPVGLQSNVLLAYYGMPDNDVEFPTSRTGNYVFTDEALTAADMQMINGVDVFEADANIPLLYEKGYAGKVWMTINPNTADLNGLQLDIVNSQDVVSPIKLSPIQKSNTTLSWGVTRAADNGFYEAEATVTPAEVRNIQRPSIEAGAAKEAIKEVIKNRTGANVSLIASDMYKIMEGFKLDRQGLKCSYTENGNTHSVYSEYNMAATAFEPLGLATLKDLNVTKIPGKGRVDALINKVSDKLHSSVHRVYKELNDSYLVQRVLNFQISDITVKDLSDDLKAQFVIGIDEDFVIDGLSYHLQMPVDVNVPVRFNKDLKIPVNIQGVEVNVPVNISKEVEVDLSAVSITTPTIVVSFDEIEHDGVVYTEFMVPILNEDGDIESYTSIPLEELAVEVEGKEVKLDGKPVAKLEYSDNISATVDINKDVEYTLVIDETVSTTVNIDKWVYFGDNGSDKKTFHFSKTIDLRDQIDSLWGEVSGQIGNVNGMLDELREIVKEANDALAKINRYESKIDTTIDNYMDRVKSYIEKINDKALSLINSANSRLQPVMIANTSKGMKRLSGAKSYPTVLDNSDITFIPTTWTLETVVPLARKHVAVTNVFKGSKSAQGGDAACKSALQAVNKGDLNKVVDGTAHRLYAGGFKPGYVYEVAYSALDFTGKIATRKYYITVK